MKKLFSLPIVCLLSALFIGTNLSAQLDIEMGGPEQDTLCLGVEYDFNFIFVSNHTAVDLITTTWDFENGTIHQEMMPKYTFQQAGSVNVDLVVQVEGGAVDSATRSFTVVEGACPVMDAVYPDLTGSADPCQGSLVTYQSNAWAQGNAEVNYTTLTVRNEQGEVLSATNDATIEFQFDVIGIFFVELIAEDTLLGIVDTNAIEVHVNDCNAQPLEFFVNTENGDQACPYQEVRFTVDLASHPEEALIAVMWDFGDGNTSTELYAKHVYTTTGTYQAQLTLAVDTLESVVRDIVLMVNEVECPALGQFQFSHPQCLNDTITFFAQGNLSQAASYSWDIGNDGTVDFTTGPEVQWAYNSVGDHEVTLTVIDTGGLTHESGVQHLYVDSCNPPSPAEFYAQHQCIEEPVMFYMNNVQEFNYDSIIWQIDGAVAGIGTEFSHQFPAIGEFLVRAEVFMTDGTSPHYNQMVSIQECPPIMAENPCATQESYIFWNPQLPEHQQIGVVQYEWFIGGQMVGSESGIYHTFVDTGLTDITLAIGHQVVDSANNMIQVNDTFTVSTYVADCNNNEPVDINYFGECIGQPYHFELTAEVAGAVTWQVEGAGGEIEGSSFDYTFGTSGEFSVTVFEDGNLLQTITIFVNEACDGGGEEQFLFYSNPCIGEQTEVTINPALGIDNTLYTWVIEFGNGESSAAYPAITSYTNPGQYTITATITDSAGGVEVKTIDAQINDCVNNGGGDGPPPVVWTSNCIGSPTELSLELDSDTVDLSVYDFLWTINGMTSTEYPATFTFEQAGAFNGSLLVTPHDTASDEGGDIQFVYFAEDCQNASGPDIFHLFVENPCTESPSTVVLQGPIANLANVTIDFGDNTATVEGTIAEHQFEAGTYVVSATLETAKGDTTIQQTFEIGSCFVAVPDSVYLNFSSEGSCVFEEVLFNANTNAADAIAYINWDFGDGEVGQGLAEMHVYEAPGTYDVVVEFADFNGNVGSKNVSVVIDPCFEMGEANFSVGGDLCVDQVVQFSDISTFTTIVERIWNFGNGKKSFQDNPTHRFTTAGNHTVSLSVRTVKGQIADTSFIVTIDPCFVGEADFDWEGTCAGDTTYFVNNSTVPLDTATTYQWTIEGNTVSTLDASHVFTAAGTYSVELQLTNGAGVAFISSHDIHVIDCDTGAVFLEIIGKDATCFGGNDGSVQAIAAGVPPLSYLWNNGETRAKQQSLSANSYTVTVTAGNGKTASASYQVAQPAAATPTITASAVEVCKGEMITLDAGAGFTSYDWSNGGANQSLTVDASGTYSVQVADANGCEGTDSIQVMVHAIKKVVVTAQPAVCEGQVSVMTASGPKSVVWGGGLGILKTVNTTPSKTTTYKVTGTDVNGCKSTATVTVGVFANPSIDFSITNTTCLQSNGSATAIVTGGQAPYTYSWIGGEATSTISGQLAGSYQLMVTDSNGCVDRAVAAIGDNDGPSVSIQAGVGSNCGGPDGTATAIATGGNGNLTYTWSNGAVGKNLKNAVSGSYGVKVTDATGCVGTAATKIVKVGDNPPSIIGHVESSANGWNVQGGQLLVIRDHGTKGRFDTIAQAEIDSVGNFVIASILPVGKYYVVAKADTSIDGQEHQIPSYFRISGDTIGTTHKWLEATPYGATCDSMLEVDIKIIDLQPLDGSSDVSGGLFLEDTLIAGKGSGILGDPIPGINVSLEQIPGGVVAQTTTDEDGFYQFDNVPEGDYQINVDIPGLEMEQTYDLDLATSDSSIVELDFVITDEAITITPEEVSVEEFHTGSALVKIFPNPFKSMAYITYTLEEHQAVTIEVFNLLGERLLYSPKTDASAGIHQVTLSTAEFGNETAIYVVKMTVGNEVVTARMISME